MTETQTRYYPANRQQDFERDRAEFEAAGWEVASIDYRQEKPGCSVPLIGSLMYRPALTLTVTYKKRAPASAGRCT